MQDREANSGSGNSMVDLPRLQAQWRAAALRGTGGLVRITTEWLERRRHKTERFFCTKFRESVPSGDRTD